MLRTLLLAQMTVLLVLFIRVLIICVSAFAGVVNHGFELDTELLSTIAQISAVGLVVASVFPALVVSVMASVWLWTRLRTDRPGLRIPACIFASLVCLAIPGLVAVVALQTGTLGVGQLMAVSVVAVLAWVPPTLVLTGLSGAGVRNVLGLGVTSLAALVLAGPVSGAAPRFGFAPMPWTAAAGGSTLEQGLAVGALVATFVACVWAVTLTGAALRRTND